MTPLFVTVTHLENDQSTTYCFDTFPVQIGRSASNHLAIGHPAVPRELCTTWIEPDGETIRVEERPHLTTPLLRGRALVRGGVSARKMDLKVGPIQLSFRVGEAATSASQPSHKKMLLYALAFVVLIALVRWCCRSNDTSFAPRELIASLPQTPFCVDSSLPCDSPIHCERKARLAVSRARETLGHPGATRREHIEAAATFKAAAKRLAMIRVDDVTPLLREAEGIQSAIARRYRQNLMGLKEGLRVDNKERIHRFARLVLDDIETCDAASTRVLEKLIRETRVAAATRKKEDS